MRRINQKLLEDQGPHPGSSSPDVAEKKAFCDGVFGRNVSLCLVLLMLRAAAADMATTALWSLLTTVDTTRGWMKGL